MSNIEDSVEVKVDVPVETEPEAVEEGDTVVIVEADDASPDDAAVDAVVVATELDHEQRITRLEERLFSVEDDVWTAKFTAEDAMYAVEELAEVDEAIIEATDEAIIETIENAEIDEEAEDGEGDLDTDAIDPVSSKVHPMFRSWADWRKK